LVLKIFAPFAASPIFKEKQTTILTALRSCRFNDEEEDPPLEEQLSGTDHEL
jgi:hypothetical protein